MVRCAWPIKGFYSAADEKLYLSVTRRRYRLVDHACPDQTGYNDFKVWEGRSSWYIVLASRSEAICLLLDLPSHIYVRYPISETKKLAKLLRLEEVALLTYSVFIGHGCPQHGGCGWRGCHSLRCCTSLFLSSYELKEEVAFAYGASCNVIMKHPTGSGKKEPSRMLAEPAGSTRMTRPRKLTRLTKKRSRMKAPPQEAQNLLRFLIGNLLLVAYDRTWS